MKFSKRTDGQYRASTLIQFTVHPVDFTYVLEEVWRSRKNQKDLDGWLESLTRESCEATIREFLTARGKNGLSDLRTRPVPASAKAIEARVRALYPKETAE